MITLERYEVAVLGAGPGGYEAAIRCAQYGLKVVLIEARELGGTCLNRGCIPTKALLQSAHIYADAKNAAAFGVEADNVRYDFAKFAQRKEHLVKRLRKGIESLEKSNGVTLLKGFGRLIDAHTIEVDGQAVVADKLILAMGSAPARPPIPGIDGDNIVTSDEVLSFTEAPDSLVIIGGGVIGIEFATLFATLGKPVTVLEMMPSILPGIDAAIVKQLSQTLAKKGVKLYTNAKVLSLEGGETVSVSYELDGQPQTATAACCVVSVGRRPQTAALGLEEVGVKTERGFVVVDEHLCTSVPNLYAIGDITGKIQLAHVASAQGLVAAANCAGIEKTMRYDIVPSCVYTEPEIACIGLTEEQAIAAGKTVKCGAFNVAGNGKAMVMGATGGVAKLVTDGETSQILGAQLMAPRATDMIAEIAAVMRCAGTVEELSDTIHPHPTVSEVLMEAAHDVEGLCCHGIPKRK